MQTYMQQLPLAQEAFDAISYLPTEKGRTWNMQHLVGNGIQCWRAHSCANHEPMQLDGIIPMWGMRKLMMESKLARSEIQYSP